MRALHSFALIISSAVLLAACSSPVKLDDKAAIVDRGANNSGADARTVSPVDTGSRDALNDPQGILAKRSVYFDYDQYVIKPEFNSIVEAHAKYLATNKGRKILIQGNTDERGGSEYNLALGQKRAEAVRKAMALLGVSESQIEAVSLGKEKATGSDDAAWTHDRRADIVYN